ncbi:MAG: hypothetical protein GWO87_03325 [Xanthomonadaceae bacterium]|nr:hypothetical protein [Rhodospirillaceae bacterium]NIA18192.1 hypothetical protein [Xanthomonadaceae bacterium]
MSNFKIARQLIRIILILLPILAFVFLVDKNFALSGKIEAVYNFDKNNPIISILKPSGRALKIEKNKNNDYSQSIIIDPVYFDLYLPTKFQKVKLIFIYQKPKNQIIKVGPQIFNDGWNYYLKELKSKKKIGNWEVAELDFNLNKVFLKDRKIKFMISAPGLDKSGQKIKITRIKAILTK